MNGPKNFNNIDSKTSQTHSTAAVFQLNTIYMILKK